VLVSDVEPDSPAALAGIRAGDLLSSVDGAPVSARFYEEIPSFYKRIADLPAGARIHLECRREGQPFTLDLVTQEYGRPSGVDFEVKDWGFAVRSITKQTALDQRLDDASGVIVAGVKAGGPAEQAGLGGNDVVRFVDDHPVTDLESFRSLYTDSVGAGKTRVMLQVRRRDTSRFVLLKLNPVRGEGS
jgi:serine protease Do